MDGAAGRAEYADARHVRSRTERISVRNAALDRIDRSEEEGIGVRVRVGGAWGFAATRRVDRGGAEAALARALEVARSQPRASDVPLAPESPARGSHRAGEGSDPFEVALEDKLEPLVAAEEALRGDPRVKVTRARFLAYAEEKTFASTEGSLCDQSRVECGGGLEAVAVGDGESQVRSYPGSHGASVRQAGFEHFLALDLPGNAPGVADEVLALLSAPPCPAGPATVILDGEQVALQLHESVGHATELDRVLGGEASYAGTSFLSPADAGSLRYGSPLMQVTADATLPGGLGSFAWDDEGVAARSTPLVRDGVLAGFLSSRGSPHRRTIIPRLYRVK